jgi:hypothetical protein
MKPELEYKLYHKYPAIFRQRKLPMSESNMCFGFEFQNGWYDIIDNLCQQIQDYVNAGNCDQVEATQVKEKYGQLSFYIAGGDDFVYNLIDAAEDLSYKTCEYCGTTKNVGRTIGWIITCCKKCHSENRLELKWEKNAT